MAKIVIIGAGLTGLSTAYHLEKKKYNNFEIFEKEAEVGGLCRSVKQDGFTFDYTGHLLHINDSYFESFVEKTINKKNMNNILRKSFIYSNETYTKYPYQINLKGLPAHIIAECIEEYTNKKKSKKTNKSFYNWVLENFGSGFAKYFFVPFQTKILDYDITKVSSSWTGRFVPQTSLKQMIIGAIKDQDEQIGYNSSFYYPKENGINDWVTNINKQVKNKVKTNFKVEQVDIKNKTVVFENGYIQKYDYLITTMPLDYLLKIIKTPANINFKKAAQKLICNSVVNFNLGVNRKDLSEKHWIYFPENIYPFYRIGFPHNFSSTMAPENCSSLYGEFSYVNKSKSEIEKKLSDSLKAAKKILNIKESEILTEKIINISHAYVIYDFWREKNLQNLLNELKKHDIYSVGRYGEWKYSSMQEAVLDGKHVVDSLIMEPAKVNFDLINSQQEKVVTQ